MPTGKTDELIRRFGEGIADAISKAYEAAIAVSTDGAVIRLSTDQRLKLVQLLIEEVEDRNIDAAHLKQLALVYVARELRDPG